MSDFVHPRLKSAAALADGFIFITQQMARAAARQLPRGPKRRNATLRPGPDTPTWNALVVSVRPHLRRRGEKTNLGRELGVPPQRIHEYFVARTATPDAERVLYVLRWLATRPPVAATPPARPEK